MVFSMIKIAFSEAEKQALHHERFHHPHPRVRRKMEALWLKSQGLAHQDICRLAGVNGNTLVSYLHQYEQGGVERLKQLNFRGRFSELRAHRESIEAHLREHPPATINEARAKIAELTGIHRSPTQVRMFVKNVCGMKPRKTGVLPAKVDPVAQETFKKNPRAQAR
jgi:transposase